MQVAPIANDHGHHTILPYNTSPLNASSINQRSARFGVPGFLEAGVQKVDMEVIAISFSTLVLLLTVTRIPAQAGTCIVL